MVSEEKKMNCETLPEASDPHTWFGLLEKTGAGAQPSRIPLLAVDQPSECERLDYQKLKPSRPTVRPSIRRTDSSS